MHLIKFFLRLSPLAMGLAMAGGALSGLLNVVFIAALTTVMRGRTGESAASIFFGLCAAMLVTRLVSEWVLLQLSQRQVCELRMKLCRQILRVPLRDLELLGNHPLLNHLTEDVNALTHAGASIPAFCSSVTIVAACLVYCLLLSPAVFGAVFVVMMMGVVTHRVIGRVATRHMRHVRDAQDTLMRHFRTLINGSKEIKLNRARQTRLLSALDATTAQMRQHTIRASVRYASAGAISQTLYFLLIATLLFVLPTWTDIWRRDVLAGAVLAVFAMRGSVEVVVGFAPGLMRAQLSLDKLERLGMTLGRSTLGLETPRPIEPAPAPARIDLVDVTFSYPRGDGTSFTLGPLNLSLHQGEMVFISGGNGSGKTTLGKLLTGLYVPDSGTVCVDGEAVTGERRDQYSANFSAVFSDFHLEHELPGPVDPAVDRRAREFLVTLQLDSKVRIEQGRVSTIDLSQGQRKRLALLMAYLEDRPVYLFDEWAADQDSSFRKLFYLRILPELKARGKTLCVITHDEQYYHVADRVVYLEEGVARRAVSNVDAPECAAIGGVLEQFAH